MTPNQRIFLRELSELLLKHNVVLDSAEDGERIEFVENDKVFFRAKLRDPSSLLVLSHHNPIPAILVAPKPLIVIDPCV